jgi:DNA mismatch endonuclease (patch repair protein)
VVDPLSPEQRSERMSRVRGTNNKSTEGKVERILEENGISGWIKHPAGIPGRPDFYFPDQRLALFVDGCFWHACPKCGRLPKSRPEFWLVKIDGNRRRDNRTRRTLRKSGFRVMRVWEHDLKHLRWLDRLSRMLGKLPRQL